MSSTFQWRGRLASSALLIVAAAVAMLALIPAASSAHPGHDHDLGSSDGRLPKVPDYQKIKNVTVRFNEQSQEYIVQKPGKPPVRAHVEGGTGVAATGGRYPLPSGESQPVCATSGHRFVVVRAYDEGTKTPDTEDAHIRSLVKRMNWKFMQQSQLSSDEDRTLQMKIDCDGSGAIKVQDIEVPYGYLAPGVDTTDGDISVMDTLTYVELTLGVPEGNNAVKYIIFNDKKYSGFVGVGFLHYDPRKSVNNFNRNYTTSAFIARNSNYTVDGKDSWESNIPTHEALHVMNAALNYEWEGQLASAPFATDGFHCIDGIDILCYADGGTSPQGNYSEARCPASDAYDSAERVPIDCKFDTFFDAKTEFGEWLTQWWNVGGSENPFLVYTPGAPPVSASPVAITHAADHETYSATLKGIVNPGGIPTTYKFEYGATTSYGSSAPASPENVGSGIMDVPVSKTISVEPEVTYHYRVVATNSKGTFHGEDKTFKTSVWDIQTIQGSSGNEGRGELRDTSCSSSIHCVAVGSDAKETTLAERWDGSQWSVMTTADPAGISPLEMVSCTSTSFCMAVGTAGAAPFSEHWNGSNWSIASMPLPKEAKNPVINNISCTSQTFCIAVGRYSGPKGFTFESKTLVELWNGSEWAIQSSPNVEGHVHNLLVGVSCYSSVSCLAVGRTNKEFGSTSMPLVEAWNGSNWSIKTSPVPPGEGGSVLQSVSCPTASFCMASGGMTNGGSVFTASWDWTSWQIRASELPTGLGGISCAAQSSCQLLNRVGEGRHWNGSTWAVQDLAQPSGGTQVEIHSLSCSRPSLCTAVGHYVGDPFSNPGTRPLAERLTPTPHVKFRSEKYSPPTSLAGVQTVEHIFKTEQSKALTCQTASVTGTTAEAASALVLTPSYTGCKLFGSNAQVKVNSCKYVLYSTSNSLPSTGHVEIVCTKAGDSIEFSETFCTLSIPQQTALGTVSLANTGKKSRGRTITATLTLSGIEYVELSKYKACPALGIHNAGTYTGTYVISGSNPESKEPVGVYLANEQVMVPPLIESEKYPTVFDASLAEGSQMGIGMPGGGSPISFTCNSTGIGQGLLSSASKELSLRFKKWTGCQWAGAFTIEMNGCAFNLNPLIGELPYTTGSSSITCPQGAEIKFTMFNGGCKVAIPAQSGISSIKTENLGSGKTRTVKATMAFIDMRYTQIGSWCNNPGTHNDGHLAGTWNLAGYLLAGEQIIEKELKYIEGEQRGIWVE